MSVRVGCGNGEAVCIGSSEILPPPSSGLAHTLGAEPPLALSDLIMPLTYQWWWRF